MLFGNPYKFAILIEKIDELTNDNFLEGMCFVFVNGHIFPKTLPEISTSLPQIFFAVHDFLLKINQLKNKELFVQEKNELYNFLLKTVHQETDMQEDEAHSYWKYCFYDYTDSNDKEDDIWFLSNEYQERLLYMYNKQIYDLFLDKGYVKSVLSDFIKYYQSNYPVDEEFRI